MLSSMQPGIYVYAIQSGHPACYQACHRLTTTQTNVLNTNAALYLSDLKFHFDFSFGKSDNGAGQHAVHLARLILFCSGHFANVMGKDDAKNLVENERGERGGNYLPVATSNTGLSFQKEVPASHIQKEVPA